MGAGETECMLHGGQKRMLGCCSVTAQAQLMSTGLYHPPLPTALRSQVCAHAQCFPWVLGSKLRSSRAPVELVLFTEPSLYLTLFISRVPLCDLPPFSSPDVSAYTTTVLHNPACTLPEVFICPIFLLSGTDSNPELLILPAQHSDCCNYRHGPLHVISFVNLKIMFMVCYYPPKSGLPWLCPSGLLFAFLVMLIMCFGL